MKYKIAASRNGLTVSTANIHADSLEQAITKMRKFCSSETGLTFIDVTEDDSVKPTLTMADMHSKGKPLLTEEDRLKETEKINEELKTLAQREANSSVLEFLEKKKKTEE